MAIRHLTLDQARRMTLAAQGLDQPQREGRVRVRHLQSVIYRLGLLQLDFVNVLIPAHLQVLFSRLGSFPFELLDEAVYLGSEYTEQWAHEASIIPMDVWPLLRDRMLNHRLRPWGFEKFMAENRDFVASALAQIRRRGPLGAEELEVPDHLPSRSIGGAWSRSTPRCVLEAFFGQGVLAVTERRKNFARRYDLVERVVPEEHRVLELSVEEAHRRLLLKAVRGLGFGTAADLADYYRMSVRETRPRLDELVQEGRLLSGSVETWTEPVYLHPESRVPRRIGGASLVSPFDPLIWFRPRVARLFGFEYRLEIFVPKARRRWGYYVLPFLLDGRLVARVDLKADRQRGRLRVRSAYLEDHADSDHVARSLARELCHWAEWLNLPAVEICGKGAFERRLSAELG